MLLVLGCGTKEPPAEAMVESDGGQVVPGPMPLRRLSRLEYGHAVRDLFGASPEASLGLASDVTGDSGFSTGSLVDEGEAKNLGTVGAEVATQADPQKLVPCEVLKTGVEECGHRFISVFGRRALRRPLSEAEEGAYRSLFDLGRRDLGLAYSDALRLVIEAMLQSPGFLYHWELGAEAAVEVDGIVELNDWEIASRLSFLLWRTIPDEELLDSAEAGLLHDTDGLRSQVERMLDSPKADDTLRSFFLQWLQISLGGVSKDEERYPEFDALMATAMEEETVAFAVDLLRNGGTFSDLFRSPKAFVNGSLGAVYGVEAKGADLEEVTLDSEERPGILTRAAFLTSRANAYDGDPTKRGAVIRRRILCGEIPPPPANIPELPARTETQTVREQHEAHMTDAACVSCHRLMDPIGFGLGNFDAIGRFHAEEGGQTVDPSGTVENLDGEDRKFSDAAELMEVLADSAQARACFVRQWFRFSAGRAELPTEEATVDGLRDRLSGADPTLRAFLVALAVSPLQRFRTPAEGEITQ
ncbi:MAG: DUF1592 domain-containing protein [Myxococcales bacterium]|nr:DUF1592 domain-containing protein [Myxococcales bacterium]